MILYVSLKEIFMGFDFVCFRQVRLVGKIVSVERVRMCGGCESVLEVEDESGVICVSCRKLKNGGTSFVVDRVVRVLGSIEVFRGNKRVVAEEVSVLDGDVESEVGMNC